MTMVDTRVAVRSVVRRPVSSLCLLATIAMAMTGVLVSLSIAYSFRWRPLPYPQSEELYAVSARTRGTGAWEKRVSLGNFADLRQSTRSFKTLHGFLEGAASLQVETAAPSLVLTGRITAGALQDIGKVPAVGRELSPDAFEEGGPLEALASWELWQTRFAGSSKLPKSVQLDGERWQLVGVLPPGFKFSGRQTDVWLPLRVLEAFRPRYGGAFSVLAFGRLDEQDVAAARTEIESATQWLREAFPRENEHLQLYLEPLREHLEPDGELGALATLILIAMLIVFVAAASNLGVLATARLASRLPEARLRRALGAGAVRAIAPTLLELTLLLIVGSGLAIVLAKLAVGSVLYHERFTTLPAGFSPTVDSLAVLAALGVSLVGLVVAAIPPISSLLRREATIAPARGVTRPVGPPQLAAIALQTCLAVATTVTVAFVYGSYKEYSHKPLGFTAANLVKFEAYLNGPLVRRAAPALDQIAQAAGATPGVVAVGYADRLPRTETHIPRNIALQIGQRVFPDCCPVIRASNDYIRSLEVPLLAGRWFDERDGASSAPVVVLSQATVELLSLNPREAVGTILSISSDDKASPFSNGAASHEVVGVIGDVVQDWGSGMASHSQRTIYVPYTQRDASWAFFLVRYEAQRPSEELLRTAAAATSNEVLLDGVAELEDVYRSRQPVAGLFGPWLVLIAVSICALGFTGMLAIGSLLGERRRQEYGVRSALGARRSSLLWSAGKPVFWCAALGGIAGTIVAGVAITALQPIVGTMFPPSLQWPAITGGLLLIAGPAISLVPAWRASAHAPVESLATGSL